MAGSTGKKTTIIDSDMDIVLFINDERPPFKDVLDDFENILIIKEDNSLKIRNIKATPFSIHFKAMSFEFDFLPAANFTKGLQLDGDLLIDIQQEKVLEKIKEHPKENCYMYSNSLADAAIRFMKQQSGFVNEIVRIAKFWYECFVFV